MTLQPISVPHFQWHARRASDAARMSGGARRGVRGLMFANRTESLMERPAIRGMACKYHSVFEHNGQLHAFLPGCFTDSLASGDSVELRVEHDAHNVLASSGLRFVESEEGLTFEYEPPRDMQGALVISLVASESRTDVSVGTRDLTTVVRNIRGHDVRLITKARLVEASLCKEGAVPTSHARVVDLASAMSLEAEAATTVMRTTALANDLKISVKKLAATVNAIATPRTRSSYAAHHVWPE